MPKKPWPNPERRRPVKTPVRLQMAAFECGAVALGSILAYYGRWLPMDELRRACGVSTRGVTAAGMLGAARRYGLQAQGYRVEHIQQLEALPPPFIVYWNVNHFVVVEGFANGLVYLNDPASGRRRVTRTAFAEALSGVVLTFAPGPTFQPGGAPPSVGRALLARLTGPGLSGALTALLLLAVLLALTTLALPLVAQQWVDSAAGSASVPSWPLLLGGAALVAAALTWGQQHLLAVVEARVAGRGARDYVRHLLHLPPDFVVLRYVGDLARRIMLNDSMAALLSGQVAATAFHLIIAALSIVVLLSYDVLLGGVGVALAGLSVVGLRLLEHHEQHQHNQQRAAREQHHLLLLLEDGLHAVETLKATGGEASLLRRLQQQHARFSQAATPLATHAARLALLPALFAALVPVVVVVGGAHRVAVGTLSPGAVVAIYLLTMGLTVPLRMLTHLVPHLRAASDDVRLLEDVLHTPAAASLPSLTPPPEAAPPDHPPPRLSLRDITMGYSPGAPPLLDHITLDIAAGRLVALVGRSGSGKSTLAAIAAGLQQPWAGAVHTTGGGAFLVEQQPALFDGTIRENLTLWDTTIPEAVIIQAAQDAGIHDPIMARPHGYDTPLNEYHQRLSGGEQQRLALARALAHTAPTPPMLLLDEATSALDAATRQRIYANLRRRQGSALVMTHYPQTVAGCDEVVVLHSGHLVERGPPAQVQHAGGVYASLFDPAPPAATPDSAPPPTAASNAQMGRLHRHDQQAQQSRQRETSPPPPPLPSHPLTLREILWYGYRSSTREMVLVVGAALVGGGAVLALPLALPLLVASGGGPVGPVVAVVLLMALAGVVGHMVQERAVQRMEQQSDARLVLALWQRILTLPVASLCRTPPGELSENVIAFTSACRMAARAGAAVVTGVLLALLPLVVLFRYSALVGMVGATLAALMLLAVFSLSRRLSRHEHQQATQQHRQQQLLEQFIRGQSTLRTARAESRALACWWERFHALYTPGQRIPPPFRALEMLYSAGPLLLVAGVLATLTTAAPSLSPGHQIAALVVVAQVQAALLPLAFVGQEVLATGPVFARIQPFLATAAESAPPRRHPGRLRGAITVDGVCFGYPSSGAGDAQPVLNGVSLHIEPGEWVVLTGPSGAGKSTLVRLLLGFALPQSGAIFYDGYEVGPLDMPAVREQMGVVLQHQRIVPGNLWYNIAGERDLSRQQVEETAALVGLDALIRQMPMGLKTPLTEGGVTLSGGQRQQIFLARALVAQPAIVLLDEATSALDGRLHQRIITHLASMSATRILITHDARLAAQADRVVTLERGGRVDA